MEGEKEKHIFHLNPDETNWHAHLTRRTIQNIYQCNADLQCHMKNGQNTAF